MTFANICQWKHGCTKPAVYMVLREDDEDPHKSVGEALCEEHQLATYGKHEVWTRDEWDD